jgi:hypothetical protein
MGQRLSHDSFMSTLGKPVAATQITHTLARPLRPELWEVYISSEANDERDPVPLPSMKVSDQPFE